MPPELSWPAPPKSALRNVPHLANFITPPWLKAALAELGQREVPGKGSNQRILDYRQMAGLSGIKGDDSDVPWCAIFINAMLAQAGVKTSGSAMARSFAKHPHFERLAAPMVGCIVVISSSRGPASGHVFFYAGETATHIWGCGGNQNDGVTIDDFSKDKLVGYFWPRGIAKLPAPFDKPVKVTATASAKAVRDA